MGGLTYHLDLMARTLLLTIQTIVSLHQLLPLYSSLHLHTNTTIMFRQTTTFSQPRLQTQTETHSSTLMTQLTETSGTTLMLLRMPPETPTHSRSRVSLHVLTVQEPTHS